MTYQRKSRAKSATTGSGGDQAEAYVVYFEGVQTTTNYLGRSGASARLEVTFKVEHTTEAGKRTIRGAPEGRWDNPVTLEYAQVSAYVNADPDDIGAGEPYGSKFTYGQPYSVDADRCKRMGSTFAKVERGLTRLEAQQGSTRTFGQYVGRVALALGIEGGVWKLAGSESRTYRYDDADYRFGTLGEFVDHLDREVYAWQREHAPRRAEVTEVERLALPA